MAEWNKVPVSSINLAESMGSSPCFSLFFDEFKSGILKLLCEIVKLHGEELAGQLGES